MRTIEVSEVTKLVRQLCIDANYYLPADLRQAFVDGQNAEESPLGKTIFGEMIANCDLARENNVPVCQDTGMAIVFAEIGQDVHLTGGSFEDAVTEGVRRGYIDGYLRLSVVGDPLRRENTNDNTPCILYTSVVPGDKVKITVAPKGFGSENMTQMKMFTPAATKAQIVDFIADACIHAGSNPCPPIVIGVGLGGTSDKAAYLAKRALLRPVDQHNADPLYAEMEQQILDKVNASGVGPQGLGGTVTALACAIEPFGTHIAGLPGAIIATIGCVAPSCIIVLSLAYVYTKYKNLSLMKGILSGLRPVVIALIASAGLSICKLAFFKEGAAGFGLEFLDPQNLIFFAAAFFILRKWEPSPIKVMVGVGVISALLSFI